MNWLSGWRRWLADNCGQLAVPLTICSITAAALLINPARWLNLASLSETWRQAVAISLRAAVYLALPLLSAPLLGLRFRDLGIAFGQTRYWLIDIAVLYALTLPLLVLTARTSEFQRVYPYLQLSHKGSGMFAVGSGILAFYMLGWEFLLRGYLLFSLHRRIGVMAIAVQMLPFALLHTGKPAAEAFGSIFAGIVLGLVALRGRSFLPAFILHYAVALTMDALALLAG